MRIAGVTIPDQKRVDIALTYIYGVGRSNVLPVLEQAGVAASKRAKTLTEDEVKKLTKALDAFKIEGDLRT